MGVKKTSHCLAILEWENAHKDVGTAPSSQQTWAILHHFMGNCSLGRPTESDWKDTQPRTKPQSYPWRYGYFHTGHRHTALTATQGRLFQGGLWTPGSDLSPTALPSFIPLLRIMSENAVHEWKKPAHTWAWGAKKSLESSSWTLLREARFIRE